MTQPRKFSHKFQDDLATVKVPYPEQFVLSFLIEEHKSYIAS